MDRNPSETARKIAENALSRLAASLEAGRSEALTHYWVCLSQFRQYSWENVLLIAAQRPDASRVAGMHGWHDLGRSVKKGEKGIMIFAPLTVKNEVVRGGVPAGDFVRRAGLRAAYVFDVSQTEGKPLPAVADMADPEPYLAQLERFAAKQGIDLRHKPNVLVQGVSGTQAMTSGLSPAQEVLVLTKALAQAMLDRPRHTAALPMDLRGPAADGVAYVVLRGLGLETGSTPTSPVAAYTGDKKMLAQSLIAVQQTSAEILDELLPVERISAQRSSVAPRQSMLLDAKDFSQLHRDYRDRMIRSLTGWVRDRDAAEDIAAQAFRTAWEKRENFRGESQPSTWVETIARNEARQSLRRARILRFDSVDRTGAVEIASPELVTDELEKRDDRLRLQMALGQLPDRMRRALTSHFIEGLSIREIASRERVPPGTVLSRIFKGKELLREAWKAPFLGPKVDEKAIGSASTEAAPRQKSQSPRSAPERPESRESIIWDR